jgi:hypothetical protein
MSARLLPTRRDPVTPTAPVANDPSDAEARAPGSLRGERVLVTVALRMAALVAPGALLLFGPDAGVSIERSLAALVALSFTPGLAIVGFMRVRDPLAEFVVSMAAGVAVSTSVSLVMVLADLWAPTTARAIITGASVPALLWHLRPASLLGPGFQWQPGAHRRLARIRWRDVTVPPAQTIVGVVISLGLWAAAVPQIEVSRIDDFGLISALPLTFWLALVVLAVSFGLALTGNRSPSAVGLALHVIALLVILHGTLPQVYEVPRYAWVYKHLGVAAAFQELGIIPGVVDVYHSWPGLFAFTALFSDQAGFVHPIAFAAWAQLFFGLMYAAALAFAFRSFTGNSRLIWLAIWLFVFANWVGQDYFAPQAAGFLFHLVVIGCVLRWLRPRPRRHGQPGSLRRLVEGDPARDSFRRPLEPVALPVSRRWVVALVLFLFAFIVATHPLTPFMTMGALLALLVMRRARAWDLWWLMLGVLGVWLTTMAWDFLVETSETILGSLGSIFTNTEENVIDLSGRTLGRTVVAQTARGLTVVVVVFGFVGVVRAWRQASRGMVVSVAALAFAPAPMLIAQSYGGEMIFRIFLFGAPWLAFLMATSFFPSWQSWATSRAFATIVGLSTVLALAFVVAHFGNERSNRLTQAELDAIGVLYDVAEDGALITGVAPDWPIRPTATYYRFEHWTLLVPGSGFAEDREQPTERDIEAAVAALRDWNVPAEYIFFSRSQREDIESLGRLPPGSVEALDRLLASSPYLELVIDNGAAQVYRLTDVPLPVS